MEKVLFTNNGCLEMEKKYAKLNVLELLCILLFCLACGINFK